ncbi:pseudouridine-metabolizing bifunctional protein C1861.05 [Polypterus senegalus]|uniref:pseudouridine-metabolizing bifunctional protein C1861.05 n=1 Tax=Polypterus senegalus TaxID=55291 RepID=UPI0019648E3B|nr:pseudouridine-metabolizing bifunctional protein C1861.05 [Polypterus senegalus]
MLLRLTSILQKHQQSVTKNLVTSWRHFHDNFFKIMPSVSAALANQKPVVALESTIITHGMPFPQNVITAKRVEDIVKANGAIPATIGVLNGKIHVGWSEEELEFLASLKTAVKISRWDLPCVLSKGLSGGMTVSATMIAAHKAGIPVFVTGGIGGVHLGGETTMDVSADLTELGRTPIAVVSAGVKSILDIGRTLEYLETQGVSVATFGKSCDFPAFFVSRSGFLSPYNVTNEEEAAAMIEAALTLGLNSGVLLAVPIPEEKAAIGHQIENAIEKAVAEARAQNVIGKEVTPFILQRVNELMEGKSLEANMALIENNAKVGSKIAVCLSKRMKRNGFPSALHTKKNKTPENHKMPVVIGGINVDFIAKMKEENIVMGETNLGIISQSFGGVGRNLADCLTRLGEQPLLISAVGEDVYSDSVFHYCRHMNTSGIARLRENSTATYCAVITNKGEIKLGFGDMDIHQEITKNYVSKFYKNLASASLVCLDGNLPVSTINYVCDIAQKHSVPVWYEPTDPKRACKPFLSDSWKSLTFISPNLSELYAINQALGLPVSSALPTSLDEILNSAATLSRPLLEFLKCVIVTLGAQGVLLCGRSKDGTVCLQPRKDNMVDRLCSIHYSAIPVPSKNIINVSGAGDSLAAAIMAGILQGHTTDICVKMGLLAAHLSLESKHPTSPHMNRANLSLEKIQAAKWPQPTFRWIV